MEPTTTTTPTTHGYERLPLELTAPGLVVPGRLDELALLGRFVQLLLRRRCCFVAVGGHVCLRGRLLRPRARHGLVCGAAEVALGAACFACDRTRTCSKILTKGGQLLYGGLHSWRGTLGVLVHMG